MPMTLYQYRTSILKVSDGDTLICYLDRGMRGYREESLRIAGVNAPELFSGTNRVAGAAARDFVIAWVASAKAGAPNPKWPFEVETFQDLRTFNRYIGHIVRVDTGESLADALVAAGHAVRANY